MKTIEPDLLLATLAEALETMAFVAIEPASEMDVGENALQVQLAFTGPVSGQLSLCAPRALGLIIAANLAAIEPAAVSTELAADALRELANVTAGLLLRQVCTADEMPQLNIPEVSAQPKAASPHAYCLASLSADGHPVMISLRTEA